MDLSSFPFLLASILLISLVLAKTFNGRKSSKKLPPGPWKLPLIGSIHHLGDGSQPHRRYRELAQIYGPVMHLKLGEVSTMVVSSAEVAKEVLKTQDIIFAQRPHFHAADIIFYGSTSITFSPVGTYWKLIRKTCAWELLNPKGVRSANRLREKEVSNFIRILSAKSGLGTVNLSDELIATVFGIITKAAFGEDYKGKEEMLTVTKMLLMKTAQGFRLTDLFPSQKWLFVVSGRQENMEKLHRKADMVLEGIISGVERGREGDEGEAEAEAQCLLRALLKLKDNGEITRDNVKAVMLNIILGGTETSSIVVEWAIAEMLRSPRVMKRAQAEVRQVFGTTKGKCNIEEDLEKLKYLEAVIKETLRLHPPAPFLIPRECRETCEINGYTIPIGTQVFVSAWAIGRDPKSWGSSAEEFFPERFLDSSIDYKGFNFDFIPFGAGKRSCPGMLFGVTSLWYVLSQLLYHFDWELPSGTTPETLEMGEVLATTMRRKTDLIVIPKSYNPMPLE